MMKTILFMFALAFTSTCLADCGCGSAGCTCGETSVRVKVYRSPVKARSYRSKTKVRRDGRVETRTTIRN